MHMLVYKRLTFPSRSDNEFTFLRCRFSTKLTIIFALELAGIARARAAKRRSKNKLPRAFVELIPLRA